MTDDTVRIELVRPMRLAGGQEAAAGDALDLSVTEAAAAVHNGKAVYAAAAPAPVADNGHPTEAPGAEYPPNPEAPANPDSDAA